MFGRAAALVKLVGLEYERPRAWIPPT
jgi:hypothetical protein